METQQASRSLNTVFQISQSADVCSCTYSVDVTCSLSLSGGAVGTVYLEYADDDAFTENVRECSRSVNGNTGTLALGLNITQTFTATVAGAVPSNRYIRIRTEANTGSPTFTYRSGHEAWI